MKLALAADRVFGLQGIVHTDQTQAAETAASPLIPVASALDSPRWRALAENQTPAVPTTDDHYRHTLAPVLRHAKKVMLIDRYLTPHEDKFFRTVKLCMKLLRSDPRGFRPTPIYIHAGDPQDRDRCSEQVSERLQAWCNALEGFISAASPYEFEVWLWREAPPGQRFHDRYFLTDQCAIAVQSGLDVPGVEANETTWALLDNERRRGIEDLVRPEKSPWTKIGELRIRWSQGRLEKHINSHP